MREVADAQFDASIRSVDLRIAIGEHYGFDFKRRVLESNSNSLAAIYVTRSQLEVIADDLGVDELPDRNKADLQDAVREAVGVPPRGVDGLDWREVKSIAVEAGVTVPPEGYRIDDLEPELSEEPDPDLDETDRIQWTDVVATDGGGRHT
ncbi:MAG: hypothetical protein ABEJ58_05880 [Halodesulfurarchaeum sp.]